MAKQIKQTGIHLRHCYQGDYGESCKYCDNDCPAKPKDSQTEEMHPLKCCDCGKQTSLVVTRLKQTGQCWECYEASSRSSVAQEIKEERGRIKNNVKDFLMGRYLVTTGDKYRLNEDDHKRLDEILYGRELKPDEKPI